MKRNCVNTFLRERCHPVKHTNGCSTFFERVDGQFAAVFARGTFLVYAKQAVKGGNARETYLHRDLCDRKIRARQQFLRRLDAPVVEVVAEGVARVILEQPGKVEFAESHQRCRVLECERVHVMLVDVCQQIVELLDVFPLFPGLGVGGGKPVWVVGAKLDKHGHHQCVHSDLTVQILAEILDLHLHQQVKDISVQLRRTASGQQKRRGEQRLDAGKVFQVRYDTQIEQIHKTDAIWIGGGVYRV